MSRQLLIVFPFSVYGDLKWYLQSKTSPSVRPRPVQQQNPSHHLHQQQPSASLKHIPAALLQHSPSAFHPSTPHSALRGEGGVKRVSSVDMPVADPIGLRCSESSAHPVAHEASVKQVHACSTSKHHWFNPHHALLQGGPESSSNRRSPVANKVEDEAVVVAPVSGASESLPLIPPVAGNSSIVRSSDASFPHQLSALDPAPSAPLSSVPPAESAKDVQPELEQSSSSAPSLAIAPEAISLAQVPADAAAAALSESIGGSNPILKTLQQLQVPGA
jgi:hypothetical protein